MVGMAGIASGTVCASAIAGRATVIASALSAIQRWIAHQSVRKRFKVVDEGTVMERHQIPEAEFRCLIAEPLTEWARPGMTTYKPNRASKINVFLLF